MVMQSATLISMFTTLSQLRLRCSILRDTSICKAYKVWVHCKLSCHSLLEKLKVLGTEDYS